MVKIGIIGIGKWGKNHLRSLSEIDCELIGISDIDEKKKEIAETYGINYYTDYRKLLKEIDAVIISTPTDSHYQIVIDCLKTGKHVLVEKPIAINSKESKRLVQLAESKNLILSVGYLFRFNNSIKKAKELIKEIGEIQYITCRYIHSTKPPRGDSGAILNLGIHPMDILNYITNKRPSTVFAKKKNLLSEKYEDSAIILLEYKDFFNQKVIRYPLIVTNEKIQRKDPIIEDIKINEPLKDELKYFINLVDGKNNKALIETENIGEEEYYTTRICELSIKSAETGKEMEIK